jgi:putative spermidine/putrescine transport system substrate-binding protein
MKKLTTLLLIVIIAIAMLPAAGKTETQVPTATPKSAYEGSELVVATWGWTAANVKKLSTAFEEKYGVKVLIDETSGNADRLNKVKAQRNNPQIDVVLMSESFSVLGNADGVFEKIDTSVVTNLDNLYGFAKNKDGYGPCYSLVRYGIIYNKDVVPAPKSYVDLFNGSYDGLISLPDMSSTAGPYLLVAMTDSLSGSEQNVDPVFAFLAKNSSKVAQFYTTSSEVQTAFTTGEIAVSVFMDMNMPLLTKSGLNVEWVDAAEGSFSAAATANVVKNSPNPELAQLYVNYLLSDEIQNQVSSVLSEAPTSKNATMAEESKKFLAFGTDSVDALRSFDESYIRSKKAEWIDRFQREVTIQ